MSPVVDPTSLFDQAIAEHQAAIESLRGQQALLQRIAQNMTRAILAGKKVLWRGRG